MIQKLSETLGMTTETLLHAIRVAAGDGLVVSFTPETFSHPDEHEVAMVTKTTGWAVAIVCGPKDRVSSVINPQDEWDTDEDATTEEGQEEESE